LRERIGKGKKKRAPKVRPKGERGCLCDIIKRGNENCPATWQRGKNYSKIGKKESRQRRGTILPAVKRRGTTLRGRMEGTSGGERKLPGVRNEKSPISPR